MSRGQLVIAEKTEVKAQEEPEIQIVLPSKYHQSVLALAHSSPLQVILESVKQQSVELFLAKGARVMP